MHAPAPLRLDELGCLQFERFCAELLGFEPPDSRPWGAAALLRDGAETPDGRSLPGPALVLVVWLRDGATLAAASRLGEIVDTARADYAAPQRSLLLLTNVAGAGALLPADVETALLGPADLSALVRSRPDLRYRVPALLGVAELDELLPSEARARSTGDLAAAAELARVFVPTRAYADALAVLERHRFVVLSGPPEMGKTAIARMLGLVALSDGWELHECVSPDELWSRFDRARRQVFVADDAFGSTEYRPDAAERWALELDRVLRALDERHRLIWTSRPAPLRAGLRRIHREHGVERFPQPAEVGVDASELDVGEKALILFRHARGAELPAAATRLVRAHGFDVVSHPHFTPERIRRFVGGRLLALAGADDDDAVAAAVAEEIREPTPAMSSSYRSLAPDHRAVLLALLDTPAGPVPERELAAAVRRHAPAGLPRPAPEVVDRLTDHFLRVVSGAGVAWVHPSWRDLVIEELAADGDARRRFLSACGAHGVVLALSGAGGAAGERTRPLLREDADWDALAGRLAELAAELDPPVVALLLNALADAYAGAAGSARAEIAALARESLERIARGWASTHAAAPVGLLGAWLSLAAALPEGPALPETVLRAAWIELEPGGLPDLRSTAAVAGLDDWLTLVDLLVAYRPELLLGFGFPASYADVLAEVVSAAHGLSLRRTEPRTADLLARVLRQIARLAPLLAADALHAADALAGVRPAAAPEPPAPLRELSPEMQRVLELPFARTAHDEAIVARVLRDL